MKTLKISDELHKQLRIEAAKREKEIQEVAEIALKSYLTKSSKGVKSKP